MFRIFSSRISEMLSRLWIQFSWHWLAGDEKVVVALLRWFVRKVSRVHVFFFFSPFFSPCVSNFFINFLLNLRIINVISRWKGDFQDWENFYIFSRKIPYFLLWTKVSYFPFLLFNFFPFSQRKINQHFGLFRSSISSILFIK